MKKIHSFLSGQKYLLSPARKMIAALLLFSALGATAMADSVPGEISTTSVITYGDVSPTTALTVDILNPDDVSFTTLATNTANWTIDVSATALTVDSITDVSSTQVIIHFTSAKALLGSLTIMANKEAMFNDVSSTVLTNDVVKRPITVTAATNAKIYDNNTSATGMPTLTSGTLAGGDFEVYAETYDDKNIGTGKTLTPTATITNAAGDDMAANYTITYVNNTAGVITVGPASKLAYTTVPSTGRAGTPFSVTVEAQDAYDNPANLTNATTTITLSVASGAGSLSGTLAATIAAGESSATIATPVYSKSDTMRLTATATGGDSLTAVTSGDIVFSAGTAQQLAYTIVPSTGTAGTAFSVTVATLDVSGTAVPVTDTTTITLSKASGDGSLRGTLVGTILDGASNVTIATPVYSKSDTMTLMATATGGDVSLTAVTSGAIVFSAGAATHLAFTTQPSTSTVAGVAFARQPVVTIRDADSNTVLTATDQITLTKTTGTGSLGGTVAMDAVDGVADFVGKGLNISAVGVDKVLTAAATGLTPASTVAFTITGPATKLAFTTQPSVSTTSGVAFARQPVVTIRDASDATVGSATNSVTLTLTAGTGTLSGTVTMSAVDGVATFTDLSIDLIGADKVLTAMATELTPADTSPTFTITAGTADKVLVETAANGSGTVVPAQDLASGETLRVYAISRDVANNFKENVTATWALIDKDPATGGVVDGDLVASGGADGTSALLTGGKLGKAKIEATFGALPKTPSGIIWVKAGERNKLAIITQPVGGLRGMALATQPVIQVQDAAGNLVEPDYTTVVTVDILSGRGGTLGGTTNMTAVAGVVTYTNVTLAGIVGTNYVLRFTNSALTVADSTNVTVKLAPAPTSLAFQAVYQEVPATQTFDLVVPSDVSPTDYLLSTNQSWLSAMNSTGGVTAIIDTGATNTITVAITPNAASPTEYLTVGRHSGTITNGSKWLDLAVAFDVKLRPNTNNLIANARYGDTTAITTNVVLTVPDDVSATDYALSTNVPWLSVSNAAGGVSGTIPSGESVNITVTISTSIFATVGSTNGTITVGSNWLDVTVYLAVERGIDTITFSNTNQVYTGTARTVLATSEHAADVSVTYAGNAWAPTNVGTYAVTGVVDTATWVGTNRTTLTVEKASQAITFAEIADKVITDTVTLSATADSGLPVSFTNTSGPAVIWTSSNTLTLTSTGTISIVASQAGDDNRNAAVSVTRSFNVSAKTAQTITFAEIADQALTNEVTLSATASSGLTVMFSAYGPAVITTSGDLPDGILAGNNLGGIPRQNKLTFTGTGAVSIVASQAGDSTWNVAAPVMRTFNVTKAAQTITFAAIDDQEVGSVLTLSATASSGLTVSYSETGPAVITGTQVVFTGTGVVSIVASQAGNGSWNAAATVTRTFNVILNHYVEGDFDGDGLADPYWPMKSDMPGLWTIWLSDGGKYLPSGPYAISVPGGEPVRVADFDGDGLADPVIVADGKWYIWLSSNGGEAPNGPSFTIPVPAGVTVDWVAADFDADGMADPVMVVGEKWYIWLSSTGYSTPQDPAFIMPVRSGSDSLAADFDGDHLADPVIVDNGNWYFYMSKGGYVESLPSYMSSGTDPTPMVGDFDGDGLADAAMVDASYNWTIWLSKDDYQPWGPMLFVP